MISRVLYVELLLFRLKTVLRLQTDDWLCEVPSEALGCCRYDRLNVVCSENLNQSLELRVLEDFSLLFRLEVMSSEVPHAPGKLVDAIGSHPEPKMPKIEVGFPSFRLSSILVRFCITRTEDAHSLG